MDRRHRQSRLAICITIALCAVVLATGAPVAGASIPNVLWTHVYAPTVEQDSWSDVAVGPGHTVYVCGTQNLHQGPGWRMTVAKFSAGKKALWETILQPAVLTWTNGGADSQGSALAVDHAGDVIVAGSSSASGGGFAVVKFSGADGRVLWARDFALVGSARASDVVLDRFGNAYVSGTAVGGMGVGRALYTAKFRAGDGKQLWENLYSGPSQTSESVALAIDADRNTYVIGSTFTGGVSTQWVTRKISPAGETRWTRRWSGALKRQDLPRTVTVAPTAVYVAGSTQTDVAGSCDAVVVKYDLAGHRRWTRQFRLAGFDTIPYAAFRDSNGRLLLAGLRRPVVNGASRTFLAKLTPAGKKVWTRSDPAPSNPEGAMGYYGLVRGPSGSMYLSGFVAPSATDTDLLVEKRYASGKVAWRAVFGWPDGGDDHAGALALDGTAGLYVTGGIWTATGFYDATLQKYKP